MQVKLKRKGLRLEVLIRELAKKAKPNDKGGVSFSGSDVEECFASIFAMLDFRKDAPLLACESALWGAIGTAIRDKKFDQESFLDEVSRRIYAGRAQKPQRYFLLTSMSVEWNSLPFKSLRHRDCVLRFLKKYPHKFRSRREKEANFHLRKEDATPNDFVRIVVSTEACAQDEAAEKCIQMVTVLRALLCLQFNSSMQYHYGTPNQYSYRNKVITGRLHTVHDQSGASPDEMYWFEKLPLPPTPNLRIKQREQAVTRKNLRFFVRQLAASRYGKDIESALIRYVEAFDDTDDQDAIPKLWSAIEKLTATTSADYDRLIHRVSAIYRDAELHAVHLSALREARNAVVHEAARISGADVHCFQLQSYFFHLALFHIKACCRYDSLAHANEFLDLPKESLVLQARIAELRRALKFRRPRDGG